MQGIARQNGEMRYLLTVIDVFSKFAWAVPVHSKHAKAITVAFGQVLKIANPHRQGQVILQLELPDPDETPRYPALCQ